MCYIWQECPVKEMLRICGSLERMHLGSAVSLLKGHSGRTKGDTDTENGS